MSKAEVLKKLQARMPETPLMWHDDGPGKATVVVTQKEAEHYVGISLVEEDLTVDELVNSIVAAVS